MRNQTRRASGWSKATLNTAPTRSAGSARAVWCRNSSSSRNARDSSTDQGTTAVLSHQDNPQQASPTSHTGAVIRANPIPAARSAVSSLARCSFPSTKSRETSSESGSTTEKKLGSRTAT